jgi:hypothetical protein
VRPLRLCLNLIAEKALERGEAVERAMPRPRTGRRSEHSRSASPFEDLGTRRRPPRGEHYVCPIVKTDIKPPPGGGELGIEAGHLFALGAGRDETQRQARLLLQYEFRF